MSQPPEGLKAMLLCLPSELIFEIAKHISLDDDLNCFIRSCRHMFSLLNPVLYKRSSERENFAILWSAAAGLAATTALALAAGANVNTKASEYIKLFTDISLRRRSPTFSLVQICYDIHNKTPLILAAERGHPVVLRLLLQEPAIDFGFTVCGMEAIHWATLNGHADVLELLLSHHAYHADRNSLGRTTLHIAASKGHGEVVSLLLKREETNLNAKDPYGLTAAHLAARNGHTQTLKTLLGHPDTNINISDDRGRSPLHLAIIGQHIQTIEAILNDSRINVNTSDRHGLLTLHSVTRMNFRSRQGITSRSSQRAVPQICKSRKQ